MEQKFPLPPFTRETALQKVQRKFREPEELILAC